jgi:hypothetical protein
LQRGLEHAQPLACRNQRSRHVHALHKDGAPRRRRHGQIAVAVNRNHVAWEGTLKKKKKKKKKEGERRKKKKKKKKEERGIKLS